MLYFLLTFTIIFLLVLLAFIFIGIVAFSPINNFSGVINSMLPVAAGGGAHSKKKSPKEM